MKTQRNWIKGTVFVVLALASLSSVAMSAPYQERISYLAEPLVVAVCGEKSISSFDQYMAAIEWAERGGPVPEALTVNCVEESPNLTPFVDLGGDSGTRFEQYMAAIEGRERTLDAAPVHKVTGSEARFVQYSAAIEWAEQGGPVPLALTVSYDEDNLNDITSFAGYGGESWDRFEQYMAAIER